MSKESFDIGYVESLNTEVERLTAENERLRHALLGLPGGGYALEQIVMRGKGETK